MQVLKWQQVRWNTDQEKEGDEKHQPATAVYVCELNGCIITDTDKPAMLQAGRWVAERRLKALQASTSMSFIRRGSPSHKWWRSF